MVLQIALKENSSYLPLLLQLCYTLNNPVVLERFISKHIYSYL